MSLKVSIDHCLSISGLPEDVVMKVKKDLTFPNPKYEQVKRYSRYSTTNVSPYIDYYHTSRGVVQVPLGYDLFSKYPDLPPAVIIDNRVLPKVKVPEFVLSLRDTQKEAVDSFIRSNQYPKINGCIQLPTGKGKSILGLYLAHYYKTKTLIVVHKDDLVKGWMNDIALSFDRKVTPGLIKAKSRVIGDFITIATVQTLNLMSEEYLEKLYSTFGFVIQDEMHHCPSTSFGIVNKFNARYRLGLTATPERTDGLEHIMNLYFGDFCYRYDSSNVSEEKDILPVKVIVRNTKAYYDPLCKVTVTSSGKKYSVVNLAFPEEKEVPSSHVRLSEVPYESRPQVQFFRADDLVVRQSVEKVCEDVLKEYNKGHSCLVFLSQKEHCRLFYDYLSDFVPEDRLGLLYGDNKSNDEILKKAEQVRQFITITTYSKSTEGTNVKQWECAFLVSSINNEKNTEQAAGRIRRIKPGEKIEPVLIYDYRYPKAFGMSRHGYTRDKRYRQLGFTISSPNTVSKGLFKRGFMK